MAVQPKCMFRNERVPWYKVCLSVILLTTANCTINVGKFNTKIKQYFFFKICNGKVYDGKERQIKISLISLTHLMFQIKLN